jgi:hypothetical protein
VAAAFRRLIEEDEIAQRTNLSAYLERMRDRFFA